MEKLQQVLHYHFNNINLLKQALTHSSVTSNIHRNYERLEFVGDRVLGMTMAHLLYKMFPNDNEGVLARRHVKLVCAEAVAHVSLRLGLNKYIVSKEKDTAEKQNVLCDVGEAIIGAIYMDSDIENAISYVEYHWKNLIDKDFGDTKDYKTQLQEKFHSLKLASPVYEVVEKSGTEHEPIFKIKVSLNDDIYAYGSGKNKKMAEQQAAENLLNIMRK